MEQTQTLKPVKLNMDFSMKKISPENGWYILNQEVAINPNGGTNNGASLGLGTPFAANYPACEIEQPRGENYTILKYHSQRTEESYSGIYNSNGVNWIQRINSKGECEIVYQGDCLSFNPAPKHSIEQWRCSMRVEKICKNWSGKELIWVDGDMVSPGCLDVEASIATNFFTTPFFDICSDPCAYIQLCVPEICQCIVAEFVPLSQADYNKSNYIVDKTFKFMVKHVYYDGRASEYSPFSSLYYQNIDCLGGLIGAARCIKLRVPVGNPMVEKIVIAFSEDGGTTWYEYETVEKYKAYNNSQEQWYERQLSELITSPDANFSLQDCSFDYIFCNDKNRKTIDAKEVSRVRNPIPRKAQTLFQFTGKFAFFNYEDGVCPLPTTEIEKMEIGVDCNDRQICITDMVEVTVRAIIYQNVYTSDYLLITGYPSTGFIYRLGGDSGQEPDNELDVAYWDSMPAYAGISEMEQSNYNQRFFDKTRNFIVYIEGTDYWAEMKQWRSDAFFKNKVYTGVLPAMGTDLQRALMRERICQLGQFYYQEAKLSVPKGTKGFLRLVSNEASDGFGDRQNTSVGTVGVLKDITQFKTHSLRVDPLFDVNGQIKDDIDYGIHEIYFDTCNGNFDTNQAILIRDNSHVYDNGDRVAIYSGYITDSLGYPVEGLSFFEQNSYYPDILTKTYGKLTTDHNGFYSLSALQNVINSEIHGETACNQWGVLRTILLTGTQGLTNKADLKIEDTNFEFSTNRLAELKVTLKSCDGGLLPNVKLIISGSKSATTDANGVATFRVRNYENKPRVVKSLVANSGYCIPIDCLYNCNPCFPEVNYTLPTCLIPKLTTNIGDLVINNEISQIKNGLKPGGLYDFYIMARGNCGRLSAAYKVSQISIPRLQETLQYQFCNFTYDGTGMQFPDWTTCVEILRSENLNSYELQWIVDKVERTIGGDIKLTIQSLNDYNTRFFFKTNTIYQYLEGDRVEFISNNSQILDASIYGILNYQVLSPFHDTFLSGNLDAPADYFNQLLIKDDGKLGMIKAGAIIELQRPKQSKLELNPAFGICAILDVVQVSNGDGTYHTELAQPTGIFNTFDTYFIRRNIAGYIENFQHHSPSDFWGTRQTDAGRAYFVNQYENEKRYGRYVTIDSPTQINYFGDLIKKFDGDEQGDITAVRITDDNLIQIISEHDNSLAQVSNDLLRVNNAGQVVAQPADNIISDPQEKPFGSYGCQYDHIGSILFGDGYAVWWDVNKMAYVKNDYNAAVDMSEGKVKLFTQKRSQEIQSINKNTVNDLDKLRFSTGQNEQTKSIFTTIKRLRDSGINNEKKPFLKTNDTIIFHPLADEFLGFTSFTPEGYSNLNLSDESGCVMITYLNGIPYIHPVLANKWNEFYGVAVDYMIGLSVNQFAEKEKVFIAMEQQCETFFIADNIETDKPNYSSEIMPVKFKKYGRKWNAGFLGNRNSIGGLFGTELPKGYFVKILLIRDNSVLLAYNTIDNNKRTAFSSLDQIIVKFALSESSGMTENK